MKSICVGEKPMENQNMTMLAVVLVVGLLIGGGVGWFMKPAETVTGGDGEVITVTEYEHPFAMKEV